MSNTVLGLLVFSALCWALRYRFRQRPATGIRRWPSGESRPVILDQDGPSTLSMLKALQSSEKREV